MNEREIFSLILNFEPNLSNRIKCEIFDNYKLEAFSIENLEKIINLVKSTHTKNLEKNSLMIENIKNNLTFLKQISERKLQKFEENGIKLIHTHSGEYPKNLLKLSDKPIVLFLKGNYFSFSRSVAIIGTRNPTVYGKKIAFDISRVLASQDWVIISGLAKGIDTQAHLGAIDAQGKTIAVLGTPLSRISPLENKEIAKQIEERGFLISEQEENKETKREDFVKRNRITVGMSKVLIVIETKLTGGSISTINYANRLKIPILIPNVEKWFEITSEDEKAKDIYLGLKLLKEKKIMINNKEKKLTTNVFEFDFTNAESIQNNLNQAMELQEKKEKSQKKITDFSK